MKKSRSEVKHTKTELCDRFEKTTPEYKMLCIQKTFSFDLPVLSAVIEYPEFSAVKGADRQEIEYLNGLLYEFAVSCITFSGNELKRFACERYEKEDDSKKRFRFKRYYYSVKLEVQFCCREFLCIVTRARLKKAQLCESETVFSLFFRLCDMKLIPQPKPSFGTDGIFADANGCIKCWRCFEEHSAEQENKCRIFRKCRCDEWKADSNTVAKLINTVEKYV